jgi:precorrin-2/cobalt-factor-2 C20-methyltransferase
MLYSTYIYLYRQFAEVGYNVQTVPGVSAFGAAASAAGVPLVSGSEKMAILPGEIFLESKPEAYETFETLVLFKVARTYDRLVELLAAAGRLKNSVLVISCGLPEEQVVADLQSLVGKKIPYFSLIIARKEQNQ